MKRKANKTPVVVLVIFLCSLFLWNCEQEEPIITNQVSTTKRLNVKIENWDHWTDHHNEMATKIEGIRKKNLNSKNLNSVTYDFSINEHEVQIIQTDNYTTYTFLVIRDEPQEGILENYMFKEFNDGNYKQFLLTYYFTYDSFGNKVFDTNDMGVELITDESLIQNRSGNCHPHFVEVFQGWACTFRENCTGPGNHEMGDGICGCTGVNGCYPAGETCEAQFGYVFDDCSGGGDTGDVENPHNPDNPPIGGGPGNDNSDDDNTDAIPLDEPIDYAQEIMDCINNFNTFNEPNFTTEPLHDDWLNSATDVDLIPLWDFIYNQGACSNEAQEFVLRAIELHIEIDDPNTSIESIIKALFNFHKECQGELLFKALYVNSELTNKFRIDLVSSRNNHFVMQDLPADQMANPNNTAETLLEIFNQYGFRDLVVIQFSQDYLDQSTDLGMIVTLFHEMVHATIVDQYHQGTLLTNYPSYNSLNLAFDNYLANKTLDNQDILDKEMHDIYIDFIDDIAEAVYQYCQNNNISGVNLEYAKKLVWGSLGAYDVFTENLTPSEQTEALNLLNNEQTNNSNAVSNKTCN